MTDRELNLQKAGKHCAVMRNVSTDEWLHFHDPTAIIIAESVEEVLPKLREVETLVDEDGSYAAGFLSYEASVAFDPALSVKSDDDFPLMWFGIYDIPEIVRIPDQTEQPDNFRWLPTVERNDYDAAIAEIRELIAAGETYQVNYTYRLRSQFEADALQFFLGLAKKQDGGYGAYIDTGRYAVCSASPEMFFTLDGDRLKSKPMKGTVKRGRMLFDDEAQAQWLLHSVKNRAENVMIVDMIRNDMGRIADFGTVAVPSLFDIEKYPTLWQMTSTVSAETDAGISDIMSALFPCASITGAPKPNTMRIISELETTPRRIYTGSAGFIAPDRRAQFNVAIRTVLVDKENGSAEYGVGGGILWDSDSGDEFAESILKSRILTEKQPVFELLETLLWESENGYFLLDRHLRRLLDSSVYFDYGADEKQITDALLKQSEEFADAKHRVRLLVSKGGGITIEAFTLDSHDNTSPVKLGIAQTAVDSASRFLYHKTTNRGIYSAAKDGAPGCDDVLLINKRGEITESTIANVVLRFSDELVTPPVSCGLLPGTYRAMMVETGRVSERAVTLDDARKADEIILVNSVRKERTAVLVG